MNIKKILVIISCCVFTVGIFFIGQYKGYRQGKHDAFNSIILEECWLNKQSRDIECIIQIDN